MEEDWIKLSLEFEKWRMKYIDLKNYMKGNVFHYTSAIALESIIRNKTLWVTKSDFLNDKTEYMYGINLIKQVFMKNEYKYLNEKLLSIINRKFRLYLARSYIFSTSENSDSVNLWGNYSKHEGYNIGLSLNKIFNRTWDMKVYVTGNKIIEDGSIEKHYIPRKDEHKSIEMYPGKVIYDSKMQENTIVDIFNFLEHISEMFYSFCNTEKIDKPGMNNLIWHYNNAFGSAIHILLNQIKLFKNPVFAQDEEYRIIFDVNSNLDVKKYRQFKGVFIPYIEVVFGESNDIRGLPIDSITIGPKNSLDIAAKGLGQFLKSQGYKISSNPECKDKDKLLIKKSDVSLRY
ncbi:DUF2971 domain-containing protein [Desulfosporosinus sp. PR]|uniref:DUF2971 domain-containing protein n=1 Tax=Candidatus Desulfosporosinus nitrosoreducens TaxID=3401928 RepID=UPI0027F7A3E6|nr:DUF2971 domain-containing protein [Desulfosporosinus sp. PR]MDQ7092111.1 DUF2971 domain-containing protein [Desulfosporosinus sp. PR]